MHLDPQAKQLNDMISRSGTSILDMLSERGKAIYFPKEGILSQGAEAKGCAINATIGIALEDDGKPMALSCVTQPVNLPLGQIVSYAPSSGLPDLRKVWKTMLLQKNPSLSGKHYSMPVVTNALTHGLYVSGYLFCDSETTIILPDFYWENYDLVFSLAWKTRLETYRTFEGEGFNIAGLEQKLNAHTADKVVVLLNFPNNPTGYTPAAEEALRLRDVLLAAAEKGKKVVVLLDDAYFGLVFKEGVFQESLFALLCDLHPNLLAVKLDGPTKEDYAWGFRVGFLTYGTGSSSPELFSALEEKTIGAVRASISNSSQLAQNLLAQGYNAADYDRLKQEKYNTLSERYHTVCQVLDSHPEYAEHFTPLPFNSGYFMCLQPLKVKAEELRRKLKADYSTGTIAMNGVIRLAYSAVPLSQLPKLFDNVYQAARELALKGGL